MCHDMGDTGVRVQMDCIMLKLEHAVTSVMVRVQNSDSMHPHDTHTQMHEFLTVTGSGLMYLRCTMKSSEVDLCTGI